MKTIIFIVIFFSTFVKQGQANDLIIKNVTVINPIDNNSITTFKHQWVLVKNGLIKNISAFAFDNNSAIKVVDGTGKFLIPGLMDAHVHTGTMPGMRADFPNADTLQQAFLKQQPRSYLYYGITQILDPSRTPKTVGLFNQEQVKPDLLYCGAAPIIGGYNLLEADIEQAIKEQKYFIYQAEKDGLPPKGFDPKQHSPEMVVKRIAQDGAKCIKVYAEDGFDLASDWPSISGDILARVRTAATKHGLKLMVHANAVDMQRIAIEADADILAHGMWNWLNLKSKSGLPREIKKIADEIIAKKMVYQPTLNVMRSLRDITVADHLKHPDYKNVISADAFDWYRSDNGQWFSKVLTQGWGNRTLAQIQQRMTKVLNNGERVLQYLYKKGHPLVLATDTPPAPTYASQPGVSANWEIKHMHKLGVSLPHILAAATINNAKSFNIDQDYGSINIGKIANLLLLNSNPLNTIEAYDEIHTVIIHGVNHKRGIFKVR
jgi:imidazolonepropionase-like amidohydrolase